MPGGKNRRLKTFKSIREIMRSSLNMGHGVQKRNRRVFFLVIGDDG